MTLRRSQRVGKPLSDQMIRTSATICFGRFRSHVAFLLDSFIHERIDHKLQVSDSNMHKNEKTEVNQYKYTCANREARGGWYLD